MFRPPTSKTSSGTQSLVSTNRNNNTSDNKSSTSTGGSPSSTIREIRNRTIVNPTATSNARQLLANRRQAMSMERLNNGVSHQSSSIVPSATSMHGIDSISDREIAKSSSNSGSSNSINGSVTSSPSRASSASSTGGLNRTASRVSRFRSAKAVFERLSSANSKPSEKSTLESPKPKVGSNVVSRYAIARNSSSSQVNNGNNITSPRSRPAPRSQANKAAGDPIKSLASSPNKNNEPTPRPQPRVIPTKRANNPTGAANRSHESNMTSIGGRPSPKAASPSKSLTNTTTTTTTTTTAIATQAKPPPKDLIDKIVLEIARDAKQTHDLDCTIQDLSNCDISGIPETLDFDKCFQDVEMMTEEEARKLLSRKSDTSIGETNTSAFIEEAATSHQLNETFDVLIDQNDGANSQLAAKTTEPVVVSQTTRQPIEIIAGQFASEATTLKLIDSPLVPSATQIISPPSVGKGKGVRFSDEPALVYDTHAIEDYDRRNDDIDPVAASAEYEREKSMERDGIRKKNDESSDEDDDDQPASVLTGAVRSSGSQFNHPDSLGIKDSVSYDGVPQLRSALRSTHDSHSYSDSQTSHHHQLDESEKQPDRRQDDRDRKEYIESLEREANLKQILEQNLRDLQSQYYETVRQLDTYKNSSENELQELKQQLAGLQNKLDCFEGELDDSRQLASSLDKQLEETKESSQLLEKKYHRAKKIIKDMQSREESFTRREQLYQQKLDEIEHELSTLISTFDRTIYEDGLRYFSLSEAQACSKVNHQARLDVFGLLRQTLTNFRSSQSSQSAEIKQRIVSMLEQQLASLLARSNNCTTLSGVVNQLGQIDSVSELVNQQPSARAHPYAAHRLSHPNLPYPIGVGGQPTKVFHGLGQMANTLSTNEPSPPQSVNSYPSSNSLNSLNNNNNNNQPNAVNNNNNNSTKPDLAAIQLATNNTSEDYQPPADAQATPFQTNEWHDKPVSEWTTNQVSTWLLALGLDQYISKFEDRNVNGQSLINLDSTVLKGLGVLNSTDRNLLKKKIRELRVEMEKERKQFEKKLKENLKDKSKSMQFASSQTGTGKASWKKGLLS